MPRHDGKCNWIIALTALSKLSLSTQVLNPEINIHSNLRQIPDNDITRNSGAGIEMTETRNLYHVFLIEVDYKLLADWHIREYF